MLIDATHKRWIIGTSMAGVLATALYIWLGQTSASELTGGSIVGMCYGIAGSVLMVFAGLLAAHRKLLKWRLVPPRKWWLKGHIWLGLLSLDFILCHSGCRWGGALEQILWWVLILTLVTGVFGLWLQQFLPRLLATRVAEETAYDQIPHLCQVLRRRADALVDGLCGPWEKTGPTGTSSNDGLLDDNARSKLRDFYEREVRPFLGERPKQASVLAHPMQAEFFFARLHAVPGLSPAKDQVDELERLCQERRLLDDQERLQRWLHGWLLVHVPLSVVLLVFGLAHALGSLYY